MSTETLDNASGFRLTGRKVLLIFIAFFGTIAAADTFLITSALRTWSGLEERSAYAAGKRYNTELSVAREQNARGWSVAVEAERLDADALAVTVMPRDRAGRALTGLSARASVQRPTDKRLDRAGELVETSPGTYAAVIDRVFAGQWDLVLDLSQGDERLHRQRSRLLLR